MTSCDPKLLGHPVIFGQKYLMSVTDGIGQTPCSFEHYLVTFIFAVLLHLNSFFIPSTSLFSLSSWFTSSYRPTHITSSQSSPSFSPSVTPSTFHSRLKTYLFHKSFAPQSLTLIPSGLTSRILTCTVLKGHWRFVLLPRDALQCKARYCHRMSSVCLSVCNVGEL